MSEAQCPYCRAALPKVPQRKTKCTACGGDIHVKFTPEDRTKRLMTSAQAEVAEREWLAWQDQRAIARDAQLWRLDESELRQAIINAQGDRHAGLRTLLQQRANAGDRHSLLGLVSVAQTGDAAWRAQVDLVNHDLAEHRARKLRSVQITSVKDGSCETCAALHGTVVATTTSAAELIPRACPRLQHRRGLCHVLVHGWIKRPDGTGYMDQG